MDYDFGYFEKELLQFNLTITNQMKKQFSIYYDMLIEWNKKMNLTAITVFHEVVEKHFLDSAALGYYIELHKKLKVADIGTGAGFPGVPLKILFPELEVVLLDSLNKRVNFLQAVIMELGLENISAFHGRAEEFARKKEYREQFDLCVSRAVAHLSSLSEYCLPFVKPTGIFVAYKSGNIKDEMQEAEHAVKLLGGKYQTVNTFEIPNTDYHRSFVVVQKIKTTSQKYPRKPGIPAKQPLN